MRRILVLVRAAACVALIVASGADSTAGAGELRKVEVEDLGDVFPYKVAVSPDGAQVYTVGRGSVGGNEASYVQAFARAADGSVAPIGSAAFGADVLAASWIALPQDGRHLYAGVGSDHLATFARDAASGALTPLDTVFDVSGNLVASPDGHNIYATSFYLLATYTRDATSGALTRTDLENGVAGPAPINGAGGIALSPDGRNLYLGSSGPTSPDQSGPGPALIVFARDESSGALEFVTALFQGENGVDGLSAPGKVAVSPDGRNVYVSGSRGGHADDVAMFARDASGALTYLGQATGAGFTQDGEGALAISPDGERVLVTGKQLVIAPGGSRPDGFSIFGRDPTTGLLSHRETLLRQPGFTARDLAYPTSIAFAPDGRDVYVTGAGDEALVAYRVLPRCSAEPLAGCRVPTLPHRAPITLRHAARDSVLWKWRSGQATSAADLGDPRSTTDYAFCLHREAAGVWQSLLELVVPAASTCGRGAAPCWRGSGTPSGSGGYVFRDAGLQNDGVADLRLRPGAAGRASILLRARGPAMALPTLPLAPSDHVVAQLRSSDGSCWSASYATPAAANSTKRFTDDND